ncbi:hypothetical protein K502DRAFT_361915 [Neoconidiobolus thromboides FSU 785]|nr:hypothetical protein K502DRAFT_361915 [Neoconidiobolus thromboides FSU 785]
MSLQIHKVIDEATNINAKESWEASDRIVDAILDNEVKGSEVMRIILLKLKDKEEKVSKNTFNLIMYLLHNCENEVKSEVMSNEFQLTLLDTYIKRIKDIEYKIKMIDMIQGFISEAKDQNLIIALKNTLSLLQGVQMKKSEADKKTDELIHRLIAYSNSDMAMPIELMETKSQLKYQFQVKAKHSFEPQEFGELRFLKDSILNIIELRYNDWWLAELNGRYGFIPANYVIKYERNSESINYGNNIKIKAELNGNSNPMIYNGYNVIKEEVKEGTFNSSISLTNGNDINNESQVIDKLHLELDTFINDNKMLSKSEFDKLKVSYDMASSCKPIILDKIKYHQKQIEILMNLNEKLSKVRSSYSHIVDRLSPP